MAHQNVVSKRQMTGHLRRAGTRLEKAFRGASSQDLLIRSAAGAAAVAVGMRLLRLTPIARIVTAFAPMIAFAAIYSRGTPRR